MSITTLTGENAFLRQRELARLSSAFIAEEGELAVEQIDGEDTEFVRIQEALTSLPFLASKKMVIFRAPSKSREFAEQAEELLSTLPDTTELLLYEEKFDKRSSLYKLLKKQTEFKEFTSLDGAALARWTSEEAAEQGATLASAQARYLIDRVGNNQLRLASEIEKLSILGGDITRERIDALTDATPQSTIFQLIDAALRGETEAALLLYDEQRAMKVEPQQIIAMLAWQLHAMATIKAAGDRSADQIAKQAKLNPYVVGKTSNLMRQMSLGFIVQKIDELVRIDLRGKRESLDLDAALKQFILEFAIH